MSRQSSWILTEYCHVQPINIHNTCAHACRPKLLFTMVRFVRESGWLKPRWFTGLHEHPLTELDDLHVFALCWRKPLAMRRVDRNQCKIDRNKFQNWPQWNSVFLAFYIQNTVRCRSWMHRNRWRPGFRPDPICGGGSLELTMTVRTSRLQVGAFDAHKTIY